MDYGGTSSPTNQTQKEKSFYLLVISIVRLLYSNLCHILKLVYHILAHYNRVTQKFARKGQKGV